MSLSQSKATSSSEAGSFGILSLSFVRMELLIAYLTFESSIFAKFELEMLLESGSGRDRVRVFFRDP